VEPENPRRRMPESARRPFRDALRQTPHRHGPRRPDHRRNPSTASRLP
jgi:hypothetical protein